MVLKVEVRAGAATGAAHFRNVLALLNLLTDAHQQAAIVAVASEAAIGMLNIYYIPVTTRAIARSNYGAFGGCDDRSANGSSNINTLVHPAPTTAIARAE